MPRRYRLTYKQALDIVMKDGWYETDVRGSHHHFEHAIKKGKITLPDYKNSILPIDIVKKMYDVLYQEFKRVPCRQH